VVGDDPGLRENEWPFMDGGAREGKADCGFDADDELDGGPGDADVEIEEFGPVTRIFGFGCPEFMSSRSAGNWIGTT